MALHSHNPREKKSCDCKVKGGAYPPLSYQVSPVIPSERSESSVSPLCYTECLLSYRGDSRVYLTVIAEKGVRV